MRRILLASVAASLVLTGCGGSDSGGDGDNASLSAVEVSGDKTPKVTVDKGFKVTKTESKVLKEGSGDELKDGDSVKLNYVGVNGTTGKLFDSTYAAAAQTISLNKDTILAGFIKGLEGRKIGSRVLVAIPPADGFGATGQPSFEIEKNDTMVLVFDIVSKVPTKITGDSKALPKSFPKLTLDGKDQPKSFVKTSSTASKKDAKESSAVVIEGDGAKVTKDQTVTVQYFGQVYPGGETFDESYSTGTPLTQPLSGLIPCWGDELVGKKVGSRVVLICPADVAYGDEGSPPKIKGGDTLLFAIDLLDAS